MKIETFKSGSYRQQYQYRSFTPVTVNRQWTWEDPKVNTLLEQATRALSELDAYSMIVPDVDLYIHMHIVKEANTSSRIEGTQTQMDEALMQRDQVAPERRDDWQEVQNYVQAMNRAITDLETLPLSNRLLKQTHAILMDGVRGEHKDPGEFRRCQNWIGGSSINDAVFIPPGDDEVPELMSDLEKFWHNEGVDVPDLIRIAISHYQFETVHPFLDGNGRIGRLLITLYLVSRGLLNKPSLYLSDFFERHRSAYYDALMAVRTRHEMLHWVKFFLSAVLETAKRGRGTFEEILGLRQDVDAIVVTLGRRAENANRLINALYAYPIITAPRAAELLETTPRTARDLIQALVDVGILREMTGRSRYRSFLFERYLTLFDA
ncbi:MAG: Fic family protein [Gammaproteobacteria bacterium]